MEQRPMLQEQQQIEEQRIQQGSEQAGEAQGSTPETMQLPRQDESLTARAEALRDQVQGQAQASERHLDQGMER